MGLSPGLGEKLGETIPRHRRDGMTVRIAESDVNRLGFVETTVMIERGENVAVSAN